jgi:hypothetical protein
VAAGRAGQNYDLQLTRYGQDGWRATFYAAGRTAHSAAVVGLGVGADAVGRGAAGGMGCPGAGGAGGLTAQSLSADSTARLLAQLTGDVSHLGPKGRGVGHGAGRRG